MIQGAADVSGRPQGGHVFGCQQRIDDSFLHGFDGGEVDGIALLVVDPVERQERLIDPGQRHRVGHTEGEENITGTIAARCAASANADRGPPCKSVELVRHHRYIGG